MAGNEGEHPSPENPLLPSPISSADLHQGAAMRGDSQPIVIYVAEGSGVRVRGAGGGKGAGGRWIRGVTGGDNLITAFYLLSSSSSARAALARLGSPTSRHYGNLEALAEPKDRRIDRWIGT